MQYLESKVPVFFFEEGNKVVAFSPAFDLSTYGSTELEAKQRFGEAVDIFLAECVKMGTLEDVLEECGWQKSLGKTTQWAHPSKSSCEEELIKIPIPSRG